MGNPAGRNDGMIRAIRSLPVSLSGTLCGMVEGQPRRVSITVARPFPSRSAMGMLR